MTAVEPIEVRATHIVHWVAGPIVACQKHAAELRAVGAAMGVRVYVDLADDLFNWCKNCENEAGNDPG